MVCQLREQRQQCAPTRTYSTPDTSLRNQSYQDEIGLWTPSAGSRAKFGGVQIGEKSEKAVVTTPSAASTWNDDHILWADNHCEAVAVLCCDFPSRNGVKLHFVAVL